MTQNKPMAEPHDLTTVAGLRSYLHDHGNVAVDEIAMLSGGTANYVYRVTDSHGISTIYKHAAPHSHANKHFALDVRRMDYEARILELQSATSRRQAPASSAAHTVRLLAYDKANKLLCLEDGGDRNLKAAYDDAALDVCRIGAELAQWLASLHGTSGAVSLALPTQNRALESRRAENEWNNNNNNNPIALSLYRHAYTNLSQALSDYGHDKLLGARINDQYGALLASDDECLCHGDFWPGNILVQRASTKNAQAARLTVVDWELVRRGTSATDVGQFAAEAFLLDRFRGGRGLLAAFLGSYLQARRGGGLDVDVDVIVDGGWVGRMVVHCAVHVAYWPTRVAWTDREGTQQLVDLGVAVLEAALEKNWAKVWESRLLLGVGGMCKDFLGDIKRG